MSIGYACLVIGVPNTNLTNCNLKNAGEEKLIGLIEHNLESLENIIDYNINLGIKLFRISSDIIPFGSNSINNIQWEKVFSNKLTVIGIKIKNSSMRVSMHPGQYTILNSVSDEVVERAIEDLKYHTKFLDSLGVGSQHKIILHIGGVYNNKEQAIERFIINYNKLDDSIKRRIVIENDDKSFNISEVLYIGKSLQIPVVYDNLHNFINPADADKSDKYWIEKCNETWRQEDGNQKVHYSQQNSKKKRGSHSESIGINEFLQFYQSLSRDDLDIMLEVKDKNLSAVKCINALSIDKKIIALEVEWRRYKYKILEKSQKEYNEIKNLLKDKQSFPAVSFYNLIEKALQREDDMGKSLNALLHIWGYFKSIASEKEKTDFLKKVDLLKKGTISMQSMKNILYKLALKYNQKYLLESYYFVM